MVRSCSLHLARLLDFRLQANTFGCAKLRRRSLRESHLWRQKWRLLELRVCILIVITDVTSLIIATLNGLVDVDNEIILRLAHTPLNRTPRLVLPQRVTLRVRHGWNGPLIAHLAPFLTWRHHHSLSTAQYCRVNNGKLTCQLLWRVLGLVGAATLLETCMLGDLTSLEAVWILKLLSQFWPRGRLLYFLNTWWSIRQI